MLHHRVVRQRLDVTWMELAAWSNTKEDTVFGDGLVLGCAGCNVDSGDIEHLCCAASMLNRTEGRFGIGYTRARDLERPPSQLESTCYSPTTPPPYYSLNYYPDSLQLKVPFVSINAERHVSSDATDSPAFVVQWFNLCGYCL